MLYAYPQNEISNKVSHNNKNKMKKFLKITTKQIQKQEQTKQK